MRRRFQPDIEAAEAQPRGFDDFELKLGDVMRGERATMGKSLLDVQRELRIKASYIAAIENCDPDAFDTPGFIAGYVRSYARYLNMNPDEVFATFCAESGFSTPHGVSAQASSKRKDEPVVGRKLAPEKDPFMRPGTPFVPERDGFLARIEPSAIGSAFVLLALIAGLGYGGWTVLNQVQRVQVAPSENTPDVLTDLDPLEGATRPRPEDVATVEGSGVFSPPAEALDRLYRPQALDVPVMVARDAPISTLDPSRIGSFTGDLTPLTGRHDTTNVDEALRRAVAEADTAAEPLPGATPQVVEEPAPGVSIFAVRPAWVRVRSADGSVIFEKILDAGESYQLPQTEEAPMLRAGMSGSLYFRVNGELYGPAGQGTNTIRDVALSVGDLTGKYQVADLTADPVAAKVVAEAVTTAEPRPTVQD
ncbi:helix-turn-helix domain-containing protein [Pseudooceanicola sp. LIPI14-2-Ac024]|uniref:helix-turn-helix domain-containing protein n=1 Tax=Pseudooceanicola sp. LIPI14-2-Ac024 TaxID=3344875 RepID=UPI0035CE93E3